MNKNGLIDGNTGYIGLLFILIGVVVLVFLMMMQFEQFGFTKSGVYGADNSGANSEASQTTPIDRAQNVKNLIEARDRSESVEQDTVVK